jgi:glycerophosphoryl diester phosphodiesterase
MMYKYLQNRPTTNEMCVIKVAHRGTQPENTLDAFRKCVRHGISIECDVRNSKDNIPVVIHDATLFRTFGLTNVVNNMSSEELQQYGVPLLHDVISLVRSSRNVILFIEIKEQDNVLLQNIIDIIVQHDVVDRCAIISFHQNLLSVTKRRSPRLKTGYIHGPESLPHTRVATDMLWIHHSILSPHIVRTCHQQGASVFVWTVNDISAIERSAQMGVDGIVTDRFDFLL